MKTFETILKSESSTIIRVKAETPLQARMLLAEFMEGSDGQDYLQEELNNASNTKWTWGPFEECYHNTPIEYATISKNEDGTIDAKYEPVTDF